MRPRAAVSVLEEPNQARHLLDPFRAKILSLAREPISATELAKRLRVPRQRVNYHVRQLADAGLLQPAGVRQRRGFVEKRYHASADAYVVAPQASAPVAPDPARVRDAVSATQLLALTSQTQADLAWLAARPRVARRLPTLSIAAEFRFAGAPQRRAFAKDLQAAVIAAVETHTIPSASRRRGQAFRLMLGCHPVPPGKESP